MSWSGRTRPAELLYFSSRGVGRKSVLRCTCTVEFPTHALPAAAPRLWALRVGIPQGILDDHFASVYYRQLILLENIPSTSVHSSASEAWIRAMNGAGVNAEQQPCTVYTSDRVVAAKFRRSSDSLAASPCSQKGSGTSEICPLCVGDFDAAGCTLASATANSGTSP
jgi:hypothetical protein